MYLDSMVPEANGFKIQRQEDDHEFGIWRIPTSTFQCKKKTCCKKYKKGKDHCKKCPKK